MIEALINQCPVISDLHFKKDLTRKEICEAIKNMIEQKY